MKHKIILMAIIAMFATNLSFAQDIIFTRDARRIDAQIMDISNSEIKYKEKDTSLDSMLVLSTNEIKLIVFSNGNIKEYQQPKETDSLTNKRTAYIQYEICNRFFRQERLYYQEKTSCEEVNKDDIQIFSLSEEAAESIFLRTDERLIVANYTQLEDAFKIIGFDINSNKWFLLGITYPLKPHYKVRNYLMGSDRYYAFRWKSPFDMNEIPGVWGNFSQIGIISQSGNKHKAWFQVDKSNLIISIYDLNDTRGIKDDSFKEQSF